MNLYLKIFILLLIIYILFIYNGDNLVENMDIYNYYSQYRLNNYDFNDLNIEKSKRFYPINYSQWPSNPDYTKKNKKKIKYLKAINISFDQIRNEINNNREIQYNPNNQDSYSVANNPKYFNFMTDYLVERLNIMSRNLYKVNFTKILNISGYQTNQQMTVDMKFQFTIKIRKEGLSDTSDTHSFNVNTSFVINKINIDKNKMKNVFFRTLFVDDSLINDYMPYNV